MTLGTDFTTNEQAYLGHDNPVAIIPYSDYTAGKNWDMSDTTKVVVSADLVGSTAVGDDIVMNTTDNPTLIAFNQVTMAGVLLWQIQMVVGRFVGIVAGSYKLRVIIEDADHPNGVVIGDDLLVDVVEQP